VQILALHIKFGTANGVPRRGILDSFSTLCAPPHILIVRPKALMLRANDCAYRPGVGLSYGSLEIVLIT
jgi:hypothetical protein